MGITLLAVGVLLTTNFWLMKYLGSLAGQIQEKRKTILFRSQVIEQETLLRADMLRAQREIAFLDNILPVPDSLLDFPRDVSVWANQNKLDVGFSFVKETESVEQEPGYTSFILTGSGPLNNIFNFLRAIENSRYLIQFNQYDIVSEKDRYTLLINGQIFSR